MTWKVNILEKGRYGEIEYLENGRACKFYWEFGGGDAIAIISVPSEEEWGQLYPWAAGRRQVILSRMAEETRNRRAPGALIVWDSLNHCIYLKEAPKA